MLSAIFVRSGGPPAAAAITSAASRKYRRPIAAGVITQRALSHPGFHCFRTGEQPLAECRVPAPANVDLLSVNRKGHHSVEDVDCLFVVVVAMRRRCQTMHARNGAFKDCDAAARVRARDQERTAIGPSRMVSSEGLRCKSKICCVMRAPFVNTGYARFPAGRSNSKPYLGALFSARPITASAIWGTSAMSAAGKKTSAK